MEEKGKRLSELLLGESCVIRELRVGGAIRHRLIDLGFAPGGEVRCIGISPLGDPKAYFVRGAVIAVRGCDGGNIVVD
ncbi:MAG: ferrous iron transport protein A [Clostridia bacterium]|nr:ferrous iron transport protein A [Clostridia bacterium]